MIDKREVEVLAGKTGFIKSQLEKIYRMFEILKEISKHPMLSKRLALKGGTAINHFFLAYPRLSVDLDFDFIIPVPKDELEECAAEIEKALLKVFDFFKLQHTIKKLVGHVQYFLSYDTLFGGTDRIKVEVNSLLRQSLQEPNLMKPKAPFPFDFSTSVLCCEEIYAAKCVALFDRTTPRDLFDIYFLNVELSNQYDLQKLKRFFYFFACISGTSFFDFHLKKVQAISDKDIKDLLWPLLAKQNRVPASQMVKKSETLLKDLLTPSAKQKRFFELFYEGKPDFNLLFEDGFAEKASQHPMVIWRQQGISKRKGG